MPQRTMTDSPGAFAAAIAIALIAAGPSEQTPGGAEGGGATPGYRTVVGCSAMQERNRMRGSGE